MLKKHMAACLVTTALLAAPALAQTSSGSGSGASSAASSGKFLSEERPNQWRASKLVGVDVYGPNREKVGDINEVLIDRNGRAEAVVIGVGGFLGIGEKDVAVPFDQVRWSDNPNEVRSTGSTGGGAGTAGGAGSAGGAGTGATATGGAASTTAGTAGTAGGAGMASPTAGTGAGATTGSTGTAGTAGTARTDASSANRGYPDHAMISMTKEELNNAPSFRYAGSTSRDNTGAAGTRPAGSGAGTTAPAGGTAPRQ